MEEQKINTAQLYRSFSFGERGGDRGFIFEHMKYFFASFLLLAVFSIQLSAQTIQLLDSAKTTSIRGLSVVNDNIIWVSGANGMVGRSIDGGASFKWTKVDGFAKTDFRDIEAFDANTAIIMGIDTPAVILKTIDGGISWKIVFKDKREGMFLDAMEFFNEKSGVVVGDPINGKIFLAVTVDGGATWRPMPESLSPAAEKGEAMFASSGTNVRRLGKEELLFITGGTTSRLFVRNETFELPFTKGETSGANSIAINNRRNMIVVGGDFTKDTSTLNNCFFKGPSYGSWLKPNIPPHGYRSCVEYLSTWKVICCGTTGVDYSTDGGVTWQLISTTGFHVVRKAKKGKAVYLAGGKGRVAKLVW